MVVNSSINVITDLNYNMSSLINGVMMDDPSTWLSSWNQLTGGWALWVLLLVIGLVLFLGMRHNGRVESDTEALSYAGLMISIVGMLLFVIQTDNGYKLIEWYMLAPILIVTAIAIFLNFSNRNY